MRKVESTKVRKFTVNFIIFWKEKTKDETDQPCGQHPTRICLQYKGHIKYPYGLP